MHTSAKLCGPLSWRPGSAAALQNKRANTHVFCERHRHSISHYILANRSLSSSTSPLLHTIAKLSD